MFSQASVILFTGGCMVDTPRADNNPARHPPAQCMLGYSTLPSACWDTHPPAQCMLGYTPPAVTAADSTHPTGMHSCFTNKLGVYRMQNTRFSHHISWICTISKRRMHSSGMRTARLLTVSHSIRRGGGVVCPGVCDRQPPWTDRHL